MPAHQKRLLICLQIGRNLRKRPTRVTKKLRLRVTRVAAQRVKDGNRTRKILRADVGGSERKKEKEAEERRKKAEKRLGVFVLPH